MLLAVCAVVIVLTGIFDWLSIRTQRLYLDDFPVQNSGSARNHFARTSDRIMPQIISFDKARFAFPIRFSTPHKLSFTAIPESTTGKCTFEIDLVTNNQKKKLFAGEISKPYSTALFIPPGKARLLFQTSGKIVWCDVRLSRSFLLWPVYSIGLLVIGTVIWKQRRSITISNRTANWLTLGASVLICATLIEIVLRSMPLRLPAAILELRRSRGLIAPDPHYEMSARYRIRLRPNLKSRCVWRFGEIVSVGGIPESVAPGVVHRYSLKTDAEGFRNSSVRAKIDVAALGDSMVEGMMLPVRDAWPAQLEKRTGWSVQNYGTATFGPQQELYVLRDYAIKHHPRLTVLGFYAGNDLWDAEAFDRYERLHDLAGTELNASKVTQSFRKYETLCLWSAVEVAARSIIQRSASRPNEQAATLASVTRPYFDQGMFHIPVAGNVLQFAWTPSNLVGLSAPRSQFEQRPGWSLTRKALIEANSTCTQNGSHFVLMFIPSLEQVYWPLVERSLDPGALQSALDFYVERSYARGTHLNAAKFRANRLAQNQMLAEFCAKENIPLLDLTPALQREVESGSIVYFADDQHLNAAGQKVAAAQLATFLAHLP
jgi:SGNH hydrolase-like domain, acetyltransferase AlgX